MLANEQVVDGACWRCGTTDRRRAISSSGSSASPPYADELLKGLDTLTDVAGEGRRHAAELDRPLGRRARPVSAR